jgi:hypothetical protein
MVYLLKMGGFFMAMLNNQMVGEPTKATGIDFGASGW